MKKKKTVVDLDPQHYPDPNGAPQHRHRWHMASSTGLGGKTKVEFRCRQEGCGARIVRRATRDEEKTLQAEDRWQRKQAEQVHWLWRSFERACKVAKKTKGFDGRTYTEYPEWKDTGYRLMERAQRWADRHPEAKVVRCDDAVYSSSLIVLIPHQSANGHHGVTMVAIPQNGPTPTPQVMFLYPEHQQNMLAALASLRSAAKPAEASERAWQRRWSKATSFKVKPL